MTTTPAARAVRRTAKLQGRAGAARKLERAASAPEGAWVRSEQVEEDMTQQGAAGRERGVLYLSRYSGATWRRRPQTRVVAGGCRGTPYDPRLRLRFASLSGPVTCLTAASR